MKATHMRGMSVVNVANARKLGTVQDIVLNPAGQHVVAIRIKLAPGGVMTSVSAPDVRVGRDAVIVLEAKSVPEEELTGVEGTVDLSKLLGKNVLSHGGNLLGRVEEVEIDASDLSIKGYGISKGRLGGLLGGRIDLPSGEGVNYGRDILMVPDELVPEEKGRRAA